MAEEPFVLNLRRIARRRAHLDPAAPFLPEEEALLTGLDPEIGEALRIHAPGAVVTTLDGSCLAARFGSWDALLVARRAADEQPYLRYLTTTWVAGRAQAQLRRYAQNGCAILIVQSADGLKMVAAWHVSDLEAAYSRWMGGTERVTLFYLPLTYGHERGESGETMMIGSRATSVPSERPAPLAWPRKRAVLAIVWPMVADGEISVRTSKVAEAVGIPRGVCTNLMRMFVKEGTLVRAGEDPFYRYSRGHPWIQPCVSGQDKTPAGPPINLNEGDHESGT